MKLSESLNSALCEQLGAEKFNANLYLFIAGFLKNKGFDRLASHFEGQHKEETEHSLIIYNLLTDLNETIRIPEINAVELSFESIIQIAEVYLNREVETTSSLDDIKKLAVDEDSPIVEERMREMIKFQQNEMEEANTFMDKAQLTGGDWWKVMVWDGAEG